MPPLDDNNTPGLCGCGCGRQTQLAEQTRSVLGWIKGQPKNFINGHQAKAERRGGLRARFWKKVDKSGPLPQSRPDLGPCWLWTSCIGKKHGYGVFGIRAKTFLAHRISFILAFGSVNPPHLEPVTDAENNGIN